MSKQVVNRLTLGVLLIATVTLLAAAGASSAGGFAFSTKTVKSHDAATPTPNQCPGINPPIAERHYCLDVTTYNNLQKSGGAEVDLTFENWDQSTLNKPTAQLTWNDAGVNLSFVSSNPAICVPAPAGGEVDCSLPNIPGLGSASGTVDPCHPLGPGSPPGPSCPTVKLFFTVGATADSVTFTAIGTAKESGNDNPNNAANVETQTVDAQSTGGPPVMSFDNGTSANQDATVVLPPDLKPGFNKPHLFATLANASVDCQSFCLSAGSPPFIAQFGASNGATCLLGVSCTGLDLNTDFSGAPPGTFSSANQILWTADVPGTNTNIVGVHTYDSVSLTSPAANTLRADGTRFASCDGVTFDASGTPGGLSPAPQTYFVINRSTNGTTSTFQVASSAKGKPLSFTGNGPFSGSCIRIIGDNPSETTNKCSASTPPKPTDPPAAPKTPPVLCVAKVANVTPATVRAYLWDDANGHVGY
jgi:hypothetical protein